MRFWLTMARFTVVLSLLFLPQALHAQVSIPSLHHNVVDTAKVLTPQEQGELEGTIQTLKLKGIWAAVWFLPSLEGETIETLAERAFNHWQLGEKGKDNGLLLVVAIEDRQMRFEVGYGLEPILTDALTLQTIEQILRPAFQRKLWLIGVQRGLRHLSEFAAGETKDWATYSPIQLSPHFPTSTHAVVLLIASLAIALIPWALFLKNARQEWSEKRRLVQESRIDSSSLTSTIIKLILVSLAGAALHGFLLQRGLISSGTLSLASRVPLHTFSDWKSLDHLTPLFYSAFVDLFIGTLLLLSTNQLKGSVHSSGRSSSSSGSSGSRSSSSSGGGRSGGGGSSGRW